MPPRLALALQAEPDDTGRAGTSHGTAFQHWRTAAPAKRRHQNFVGCAVGGFPGRFERAQIGRGRPRWTLRTRRSGNAGLAARALGPHRPGWTGLAPGARNALGSDRTLDACFPLRSHRTGPAGGTLRANGTLWAHRTLRTDGTLHAGGTLRTRGALRPRRASRTLGPFGATGQQQGN